MDVLGFQNLPLAAALPPALWMWGVLSVAVAALLGFVAGLFHERSSARHSLKKASQQFTTMMQATLESIERAQEACQMLERFQSMVFSNPQLETLEKKSSSLWNSLTALVENKRASKSALSSKEKSAKEKKKAEPEFDWKAEWKEIPVDMETEFPNREAFDENLALMLTQCQEQELPSGLLLVKLDRWDQLCERYTRPVVTQLFSRLGSLIRHSVRPEDCVCRCTDDVWGILIPGLHMQEACELAEKLRQAVRGHRFEAEERGHEVLVTASFGLSSAKGNDSAELISHRASTAVIRSQKMGRNQLSVHDGVSVEHVSAS